MPDPANPQSFNRYSYVNNNPINFNDPTGHCFEPISASVCVGTGLAIASGVVAGVVIYDALTPENQLVVDAAEGLSAVTRDFRVDLAERAELTWQVHEAGASILADTLFAKGEAKPLTKDEEKHIKRIDEMPGWFGKHPDLEEETEQVKAGETLPKGRDHVKEAEQRAGSLTKSIKTLEKARPRRNVDAQEQIDSALDRARNHLQRLDDMLSP